MKTYQFMSHLSLLGSQVEDAVTGFRGVVTSVKFDLFGCIQALVVKKLAAEDTEFKSQYFDVNRLKLQCKTPAKIAEYDPEIVLEKLGQLGCTATSIVHGMEGAISSLSFEADGRVYGYLASRHEGVKKIEGDWTPYCFLKINYDRVMARPNFNYTEPEKRAQDTSAGRSGSNDISAPKKL